MSNTNQAMATETGDAPHDETHDSIDPATGTLTVAAVQRRSAIVAWATAKIGQALTWAEALELHLANPGHDMEPPAPPLDPDSAADLNQSDAREAEAGDEAMATQWAAMTPAERTAAWAEPGHGGLDLLGYTDPDAPGGANKAPLFS